MSKMLFGLCNVPSTYHQLMAGVIQNIINICLAYLNNMVVWTKRFKHKVNFRAVRNKSQIVGLKTNHLNVCGYAI